MVKLKTVREFEEAILARLAALPEPNTAAIRKVRREFSRQLLKAPDKLVIELALRLVSKQGISHYFVACELIQFHEAAFSSINSGLLKKLTGRLDSWASVDIFGSYLSGPAWREGLVPTSLIESWARSGNVWLRRAALVSTVPLNSKARGGEGDSSRTLGICRMLVTDREDMVVKALSWALRELSKRDAVAVRDFIQEHLSALAPRVTREVNNKLHTGLKNPRRVS